MNLLARLARAPMSVLRMNLSVPAYHRADRTKTDLNIIATDVRAQHARQKARSFFSLVDRALRAGNSVLVIVFTSETETHRIQRDYEDIYSRFLPEPGFRVKVAGFKSRRYQNVWLAVLSAIFFIRAIVARDRNAGPDMAVLLATLTARFWQIGRLFDDFPARAWIGLTGGIELPAMVARRDQSESTSTISALQFGQVARDQYHFDGYNVDTLFVYDQHALQVMSKRVSWKCEVVIAGSPEFENELMMLSTLSRPQFDDTLTVLFIDQPVGQRSEFDEAFLQALDRAAIALFESQSVNFIVKSHPRGTAFRQLPAECYSDGEASSLLAKSHLVVSCFSNLADLSVMAGIKTVYVGAGLVLGEAKLEWIRSNGGLVAEYPSELPGLIAHEQQQLAAGGSSSAGRSHHQLDVLASETILKTLKIIDAT